MRKLTPLLVGVFMMAGTAHGQIEYQLSTFYLRGYENNIFHSPDSYVNDLGETVTEDSLIQSDGLNGFGWELELEREFGRRHRLRLEQDGWLRRYGRYPNADQGDYQLQAKYDFDMNRKFDMGARVRGSRSNKIGTNVLGEELTRIFSHSEFATEGYLEVKPVRNNKSTLEISWRNKNYDTDPGVESLTYQETGIELNTKQKFEWGRSEHRLELELDWEDKPYRDRTATDSTGSSRNPLNPRRHWRYLSGQIGYRLEWYGWTLEPYFELKHRSDLFQDYYTYNQTEAGVSLEYETERLNIENKVRFTNRQYAIRRAFQILSPDPQLLYRYLNYSLEVDYAIIPGIYLTAEYNTIGRRTNVTAETMRTRRSYNYSEFSMGIAFGLEGLLNLSEIRDDEE